MDDSESSTNTLLKPADSSSTQPVEDSPSPAPSGLINIPTHAAAESSLVLSPTLPDPTFHEENPKSTLNVSSPSKISSPLHAGSENTPPSSLVPESNIEDSIQQLEQQVRNELQSVSNQIQQGVEQKSISQKTLEALEGRLINLVQLNLIVKGLSALMIPQNDPNRGTKKQKILDREQVIKSKMIKREQEIVKSMQKAFEIASKPPGQK